MHLEDKKPVLTGSYPSSVEHGGSIKYESTIKLKQASTATLSILLKQPKGRRNSAPASGMSSIKIHKGYLPILDVRRNSNPTSFVSPSYRSSWGPRDFVADFDCTSTNPSKEVNTGTEALLGLHGAWIRPLKR